MRATTRTARVSSRCRCWAATPSRSVRSALFPLLGIEYDLNLYWKGRGRERPEGLPHRPGEGDLNQFWFKAGVGADFTVYKGLYIRPLALLGFKVS